MYLGFHCWNIPESSHLALWTHASHLALLQQRYVNYERQFTWRERNFSSVSFLQFMRFSWTFVPLNCCACTTNGAGLDAFGQKEEQFTSRTSYFFSIPGVPFNRISWKITFSKIHACTWNILSLGWRRSIIKGTYAVFFISVQSFDGTIFLTFHASHTANNSYILHVCLRSVHNEGHLTSNRK
jgi:hypothetical protein